MDMICELVVGAKDTYAYDNIGNLQLEIASRGLVISVQ